MEERVQKSQQRCPIVGEPLWGGIPSDTDAGLISIIIPAYNTEKYITECIESVLHQTYQNFEIIIIDDGSIDDTGKIIDVFAAMDKRIVPIHQENAGVSAARNIGLKIVRGKYIAFMDSDDYVAPEWLEKRLANMVLYNAEMCMCGCEYVRNNLEYTEHLTTSPKVFDAKDFAFKLCYMEDIFPNYEITSVCGALFDRKVVNGVQFNEQISVGEDFLFKFQSLQRANKIVCIEDKLYKYRILETSTMRNGYSRKKTRTIDAFYKFLRENYDLDKEMNAALICRFVNIAIVILMMIPIENTYKDDRKQIIGFVNTHKKEVLRNRNARKKVKMSLWLAQLLGYNNMQRVFKIISRE